MDRSRRRNEMPTYYLEPTNGDTTDPSWEASSLKEGCWTEANSEELARRQVAYATFKAILPKPVGDMVRSPWTQPRLVHCRTDEAQTSVPSNQILSKSGKLVDIPALSASP
jgi:hypothetical protein